MLILRSLYHLLFYYNSYTLQRLSKVLNQLILPLQQPATTIDDYAATAGIRRKEHDTSHGRQAGDPARGAQAIIKAVESPNPPAHLALGADAVARIRAELQGHLKELEAWADLGESADFPKGT